ncbi:MAG: hypothetical protein NVS3B3_15470 [Aquirhabdus sp.]
MRHISKANSLSKFTVFANQWFPVYLRFFAVLAFIFGAMVVAVSAFGMPVSDLLARIFRWNMDPAEFPPAAMLGSIYVVWAVFIWISARNPRANQLFIDFTVAGNAAHGLIMIYMALTMHGMIEHLYTDTLLLIIGVPIMLILWLPVRRQFN